MTNASRTRIEELKAKREADRERKALERRKENVRALVSKVDSLVWLGVAEQTEVQLEPGMVTPVL